jgi:hypothetical protein
MYNILRAWRLTPRIDASLERLDDPRGEAPMFASNPMIIKMKKLIPHQRANTRDPEVRNLALKGGEGS